MSLNPHHGTDFGSTSDLIGALRDKAPRTAMTIAAAQMAWPFARRLHSKARQRTTYTLRASGTDSLYDELHEWILMQLPAVDQRALIVASARRPPPPDSWDQRRSAARATARLRVQYDGTRAHTLLVAGHKIRVTVTEAESAGGGMEQFRQYKPPQIVFTAYSLAGRQALLTELEEVVRRSQEKRRRPAFRMLDRWDDWTSLHELPARDLDSVVLPGGQLERLIADVGRFLDSEGEYVRRSIPWHRGHLYEGPPGTGKTSVARAIASHFGMDVWYLPLADVKKDGALIRTVTEITPRSMLLLEDIDVFHAATQRDDENGGVTLSGLLNSLDGIATPHGMFTVMTSNTPEVLDDAVVRAGRADLIEHFGYATPDQVTRLVSRYYGQPVPQLLATLPRITPGDVVEACKRSDTPAAALGELTTALAA